MTTRFMYDTVSGILDIPADAGMVAGYHTGARIPTNLPALAAHCPNAFLVDICVTAHQDGMVLDVEKGDASPSDSPNWCLRQRARGAAPIAYCSTSVWPQVKAAHAVANVPLPWWWEAHFDNVALLSSDPRAVAKQFANAAQTGRNFDLSIVGDNWPGLPGDVIIGGTPGGTPVDLPTTSTDWSLDVKTLDLSRADRTPIRGTSVVSLQLLLRVTNDGVAGNITKMALMRFQAAHGLRDDAVAGPKTWAALVAQ